jgi:hypothetical protein
MLGGSELDTTRRTKVQGGIPDARPNLTDVDARIEELSAGCQKAIIAATAGRAGRSVISGSRKRHWIRPYSGTCPCFLLFINFTMPDRNASPSSARVVRPKVILCTDVAAILNQIAYDRRQGPSDADAIFRAVSLLTIAVLLD